MNAEGRERFECVPADPGERGFGVGQ